MDKDTVKKIGLETFKNMLDARESVGETTLKDLFMTLRQTLQVDKNTREYLKDTYGYELKSEIRTTLIKTNEYKKYIQLIGVELDNLFEELEKDNMNTFVRLLKRDYIKINECMLAGTEDGLKLLGVGIDSMILNLEKRMEKLGLNKEE